MSPTSRGRPSLQVRRPASAAGSRRPWNRPARFALSDRFNRSNRLDRFDRLDRPRTGGRRRVPAWTRAALAGLFAFTVVEVTATAAQAQPAPTTTTTPSASAAAAPGSPTVAMALFDTDIVLVGGRNFTAGSTVSIDAVAGELGGTAQARAGADGRFLIGFQVPLDFAGTVSITASEGGRSAQGSLDVVGPNAVPVPPTTPPPSLPPVTPPAPGSLNTQGALSGLPWMSGVHPSNELAPYLAFGDWRGRQVDVAVVFTARDGGWGPIIQPDWPVNDFAAFPGKLIISQPTFPKGQGSNAACARGEYDQYWKQFGTFLVQKNRADSIVRIGWEFNGTFMYWHSDASGQEFAACFRKIATAIRSTDPDVILDWTINAHGSPVPSSGNPFDAYPGDEYVDIVGIDSYDHYPPSRDEATWNRQCNDKNGLCYFMQFAREHGKKVGVGEWGVTSCSGNGGGDNPFYIQKMWDTFVANADVMGYESYYHDAAPNNVCSTIMNGGQNPSSSALYKQLWAAGT